MADPNVITAATNAVEATLQIEVLKGTLVDNPTTQAEKDANALVNQNIRIQRQIIKDSNTILRAYKVEALVPENTKIDFNDNVIGIWEFSEEIVNTSQYVTLNTPPVDVPDVDIDQAINTNNETLKEVTDEQLAENIATNTEHLEGSKSLRVDPTGSLDIVAQQTRNELEQDVRDTRAAESDALSSLNEAESNLGTPPTLSELSDLEDAQNVYLEAKSDRVQAEAALDSFLESPSSSNTVPSNEPDTVQSSSLTDAEKSAVIRLKQQLIDTIMSDTAPTAQKNIAETELKQLDQVIKEDNIKRELVPAPTFSDQTDIDNALKQNITTRDDLQNQLALETDPLQIIIIEAQLEQNFEERVQLSDVIIGLQDDHGFGRKVQVTTDEFGDLLLKSFNTITGLYETDENLLTDLSLSTGVNDTSVGILNKRDYDLFRFVTGSQLYDTKTRKIISREQAEAGQPDRYVGIRPNIDEDLYKFQIAQELDKLEQDFLNSKIHQNYIIAKAIVEEPFNIEIKSINSQLSQKRIELQDILLDAGVPPAEVERLTANDSIPSRDEYVEALQNAYKNNNGVQ